MPSTSAFKFNLRHCSEVDVCLIPEINTPLDGQGGVLVGLRGTEHVIKRKRKRSFQTLYTKCRCAHL
jgi:hypothetical protein